MSLLTRCYILEKFGPRLSMDQLSQVLGIHPSTIYTLLTSGELPISTYKEGSRRFASYEAVADYLDGMAKSAKEQVRAEARA